VRTVGDLLGEGLRTLGVTRVWGAPIDELGDHPGLDLIRVDDPGLSCLLADADGRVNGRHGVAAVPGGILHLSSKPGGTAYPRTIESAEELVEALAELGGRDVPETVALHLSLDLDEPVADELRTRRDEVTGVVMTLDPMFADLDLAFVVGPGVVRSRNDDAARRFATSAGAPLVGSAGAKGIFRWDSPFDGGTIGLQERDLALTGVTGADVVIASGIDPDEIPLTSLGPVVQEVDPWQLPALTARWTGTRRPPEDRTPLVAAMSSALTPRYESTAAPLDAARAALHLSGAAPDGGVVCAEAGWAGFWIARAMPTGIPGSVVVPGTRQEGAAAAMALAARLAGRPAVAVSDAMSETTAAVMELARSLAVGLAVQEWGPSGARATTDEHASQTMRDFTSDVVVARSIAVATDDLDAIVEAAGPVVAWDGLLS
jgi:thiamine pyrophosphate-dependent acetolactate synthase large subunit-like protein